MCVSPQECFLSLVDQTQLSDEGESTIGVTSSWVELDSPDAQVRHYSEIVSLFPVHIFFA